MKLIFIILYTVAVTAATAQTKKIAYKSHSGSAENFSSALENVLPDLENSNFGMAPTRQVYEAQLDSVIFICDTLAMMVTSEYCTQYDRNKRDTRRTSSLWNPGKIVVTNHPLFSKQHSLDSIKQELRTRYNFRNPVEKVVFIGYDNEKDKPVTKRRKTDQVRGGTGFTGFQPPLDNTGTGILIAIVLISVLSGWGTWLFYKQRQPAAVSPA